MKSVEGTDGENSVQVAPFAGAWIEIRIADAAEVQRFVAPFAGAWIEILPDRRTLRKIAVAPFAGAWIEIGAAGDKRTRQHRRSLRGSVD